MSDFGILDTIDYGLRLLWTQAELAKVRRELADAKARIEYLEGEATKEVPDGK